MYLGRNWSGNGFWHQFEKVDKPGTIWCEVLDADLSNFEETEIDRAKAAVSLGGANDSAGERG
jgi:hypothetical protein